MSDGPSEEDVTGEFERLPPLVKAVIATRAALRVLPLLGRASRPVRPKQPDQLLLLPVTAIAVFRAISLAWLGGIRPERSSTALAAAADATDAASTTADLLASTALENSTRAAATSTGAAIRASGLAAVCTAELRFTAAAALSATPTASTGVSAAAQAINTAARAIASSRLDTTNSVIGSLNDDLRFATGLDRHIAARQLARRPLWPKGEAAWSQTEWQWIKTNLAGLSQSWELWITWYENRILNPGLSPDPALEDIIHTLPDDFWDRPPAQINADLLRQTDAIRTARLPPPEPIPRPGPGPHVELGTDGRIRRAPATDFDADGNNVRRIRQTLPFLRQAAEDLAAALAGTNAFPDVTRDLRHYQTAIAEEPESIDWGSVWCLGVRLEATADAVGRRLDDRMRPAMEDDAQAALNALVTLQRVLLQSTADGLAYEDLASTEAIPRDARDSLHDDILAVSESLRNNNKIIEPDIAEDVQEAAAAIGHGRDPDRTTTAGIGTFRSVARTMIGAASLGSLIPAGGGLGWLAGTAIGGAAGGPIGAAIGGIAAGGPAWVGFEGLKKSATYISAVAALGPKWDDLFANTEAKALEAARMLAPLRDFVRSNEEPLRRIAANTPRLRWMTGYIDFIVWRAPNRNTNPDTIP